MASKALSLYRRILRLHKSVLPTHLRSIGDAYVKDEWRRHKNAKPDFLPQFFAEWEGYAEKVEEQSVHGSIGQELDASAVDELNDEQKEQLAKLQEASQAAFKDG